jgi:hypothetical protein
MLRSTLAAVLAASLLAPALAHAQDVAPPPLLEEPISPFVVDARGVMARFKQDPTVAASLGVASTDLPTRGLGIAVGAHVYPLRTRRFALGLGGEILLRARGTHTVPPMEEDGPDGPTLVTRMTAVSPQLSLNFGKRSGWSYLSGGIGWASLTSEIEFETPVESPSERRRTLNYGGGARWFAKEHLAFTFDLRFYSIGAGEAAVGEPALPAMRLMVFSAGVSVK